LRRRFSADKSAGAAYEGVLQKASRTRYSKGLSSLVTADANVEGVADNAIVKVVDASFGKRPFGCTYDTPRRGGSGPIGFGPASVPMLLRLIGIPHRRT